jgi:hypothetical protein
MVLAEFVRPFELSVGNVVISASIGVAKTSGPAAALELIRDADTAMYKAKGSGRNAYALFDTSLRDRVRDRMNLEQALQQLAAVPGVRACSGLVVRAAGAPGRPRGTRHDDGSTMRTTLPRP